MSSNVGQNYQQLLRCIPAAVAFTLLYAPFFPTAAGRLPKCTAFQAFGQIALIDPAFGIIVRILIHTVFIAARAMAIAQVAGHLAKTTAVDIG